MVDYIDQVIDSLVEEMEIHEPGKKDKDKALTALRSLLKVQGKPTNTSFLTVRKGKSNKFLYFAMFQKGNKYIAGNAYGRIGYEPKASKIADGSKEDVKAAMDKKIAAKKKKGYK